MQLNRWNLSILVLAAICCQASFALPSIRAKRADVETAELNPIETVEAQTNLDREKRKLPDGTFAAKNAIIGFVFNLFKGDAKVRAHRDTEISRGGKAGFKDNNDVPEFTRTNVMLDVPDQLFSQGFSTISNVSKVVGNFITNSARRFARFALFFKKPIFGDALIVKGYNEPTTTTTTTTTTMRSTS